MPIPVDQELYQVAKEYIMSRYKKSSAYSSGATIKLYKQLFREKYGDRIAPYYDDKKPKKLKRWFQEEWTDVSPFIGKPIGYPLYRPLHRINTKTPTTFEEIPISNLKKQY